MTYSVVGIGELLWDVFPSGKVPGGAPANFAYHFNVLGGEGLIVSSLGSDSMGDEILKFLDTQSLTPKYITIDAEHPTGTVTVDVGVEGEPSFTIHENVAWDFIPHSQLLTELGANIDAICFGTLAQRSEVSRSTIKTFIEQAPRRTLRLFDINLRKAFYTREVIEWSLEACNILKLNESELQVLSHLFQMQGDEITLLYDLSGRFNLEFIALTKGAMGSTIYNQKKVFVHDGFKTDVVDTVGSGDAFTAALLSGILSDIDLDTINDYANRLASYVCSKRGATPPIPVELQIIE
ncbi:carbohydrate kinase [Chloroflexota bacterium]